MKAPSSVPGPGQGTVPLGRHPLQAPRPPRLHFIGEHRAEGELENSYSSCMHGLSQVPP